MNKLVEARTNGPLPVTDRAAQNIYTAAQTDAGFERMIKFKKGEFYIDGELIPLGTEYVAHCVGWTKTWIKFLKGEVADRKVYRMIQGDRTPDREELGDGDMATWPLGMDNKPLDPWALQYLLPLENGNGDVVIFATGSFGGRRAVADVCSAWARKAQKQPGTGQPLVQLAKAMMPSKKWGDVPRPSFKIIGWEAGGESIQEVKVENLKDEMRDEIPF